MLEINTVCFSDLTEDEKDEQPNNGIGKRDAGYIKVTHGGRTIGIYSDAMEPEDCSFRRDLRWVKDVIEKAYEIGKNDG